MKINIKSTDLKLTSSIEKYINDKIKDLSNLIKSFEEKGEVFIYFEIARTTKHHKQGKVFYAEANVDLLGDSIRVEHTDEDIRAAIDKVKDILKRKITEVKEKKVDKKRETKRPGKPK